MNDVAQVLAGVALVVLTASVAYGVWRGRRLEAKVGHATVVLDAVNNAVNHAGPDTPPIPDRLEAIEARLDELAADYVPGKVLLSRLVDLGTKVGHLEQIARHQHPEEFAS